jgi:hypothetical protein
MSWVVLMPNISIYNWICNICNIDLHEPSIPDEGGKPFKFINRRDGPPRYSILNFQRDSNGHRYHWKVVGNYTCEWFKLCIRCSSVGIATRPLAGWPRNRGLIPRRDRKFLSSPQHPDNSGTSPTSYLMANGDSTQEWRNWGVVMTINNHTSSCKYEPYVPHPL